MPPLPSETEEDDDDEPAEDGFFSPPAEPAYLEAPAFRNPQPPETMATMSPEDMPGEIPSGGSDDDPVTPPIPVRRPSNDELASLYPPPVPPKTIADVP